MQLLGLYNSKLQAFHYAELLQLYKNAIAQGDHAGSATFNEAAITTLVQQSKDFSTLPTALAGQVVTDDSLNNPLNLLSARFSALVSEAQDFDNRAAGLIAIMEKDTILLDQLLAAADLQKWIDEQPRLVGSTDFSWNFGMGHGPSDGTMLQIDPSNGVEYDSNCPVGTYLNLTDGVRNTGLTAPSNDTISVSKNIIWTLFGPGQFEDLYGNNWAELTVLADEPAITFQTNPTVRVLLPNSGRIDGIFQVQGSVPGGSLPIYVRTLFSPRRNSVRLTPQNALPDGSAEARGLGWTFGSGWSVNLSGGARTGSNAFSVGFASPQGNLVSPSLPISQNQYVYVEFYVRSVGGDGDLHVHISCQDINGNEISRIYLPVVTPPEDYLRIAGNVQITGDPSIVSFQVVVATDSLTVGRWYLDDMRIHLPQNLSPYSVNADSTNTYTVKVGDSPFQVFFDQEDYIIDDSSNVTFLNMADGQELTVRFTELYPGYQCSVNESVWSPLIMLDPNRPYPDNEVMFNPIHMGLDSSNQRTLFPITDELGVPTGLTFKMIGQPIYEYYFVVTTTADPHYGISAILEIDMTKSAYLTGLVISPFSNFPMKLLSVECEAFTSNTKQTIGQPNVLIDSPTTITFPPTLVRKIFLTCYQENYSLEQHVVQPPDQLRRNTLVSLQAALPFNVRRTTRAVPVSVRGSQYSFGLENIVGIVSVDNLPGVFVSGRHRFIGSPNIIRYDVEMAHPESIETYLCWKAYDASGNIVDSELVGHRISDGNCVVFPFNGGLDRTTVDHVDVYVKFVLRSANAIVEKYLLQIED